MDLIRAAVGRRPAGRDWLDSPGLTVWRGIVVGIFRKIPEHPIQNSLPRAVPRNPTQSPRPVPHEKSATQGRKIRNLRSCQRFLPEIFRCQWVSAIA
jgi:hypothetical protein